MRFINFLLGGLQVAAAASAASPSILLTSSDQPVPFFDLPNAFRGSDFVPDPFDVEAIRNVLAHYPLAIDGKNFAALDRVFAPNAVANYSAPLGVLKPLSAIQTALKASLAVVTTQHSYGTQIIDVLSPASAVSVTYYTATHFGMGPHEGQIVTAYGQYQDVWTRQRDLTWRISHRNLVYMGALIGNLSIFT
ncbi:snoaL-like domain-containing protein [Pochonia chlamydosporia 170]|uniref:SnoaL-like domain-containing protein n=1 Tax=Pochonia chlamydosporia 170 TaxID=1380566 RepID=A0A179F3J5_METCM|nr:snoaL-like domain-containing protein [Pochonia chlamydosporia 170]OAQ59985.1 snoaL-like domain-containing protein [Pochonia chlamydosporia 170]